MVKFGHELAANIEKLGLGTASGLHYKELKKLLKFGVRLTTCSQNAETRPLDLQASVVDVLTSSFWVWPLDADGIGTTIPLDWVAEVLKRKLVGEAKRIRAWLEEANVRLKTDYENQSAFKKSMLNSSVSFCYAEDDVRTLVNLQESIADLQQQVNMFRKVNYTGFFKILKKYDKVFRMHGRPPQMNIVMPLIDEILNPEDDDVTDWMQQVDHAFASMSAIIGDAPDKLHRLANLHQSQVDLYGEIIDDTVEDSVQGEEEAKNTNQGMMHFLNRSRKFLTPPLLTALQETNYTISSFITDLTTSIIISVAGIPKAMAYAALAGLPIEFGISTLYMPCIVYALMGSSRQAAISPQSVTCLLLAQIVDDALLGTAFEDDMSERVSIAMMYTFTTGLVILMFGLLNLGFLLNFISRPVLSGFVSASALIAVASTFKSLMGMSIKKSPILFTLVGRIYAELPNAHWQTSVLSLGGICLMVSLTFAQKRGLAKIKSSTTKAAKTLSMILKTPSVIYLVFAGILAGGFLCSFSTFGQWELKHVVIGRGATFPAMFYESVIETMNCKLYPDEVKIEYMPSGSGDGLDNVMKVGKREVDFVGSDVKPSQSELAKFQIEALPIVRSVLCPVVNLPLLAGSEQIRIVLDMPTLAGIFNGQVDDWLDDRIRKSNPNLPWNLVGHRHPITVVVRKDSSGTTHAFSDALRSCAGCNGTNLSSGMRVAWGASRQIHVSGMEAMVDAVVATPWSIGYATLSEVNTGSNGHVTCAALAESSGVSTALMAWANPNLVNWPLWLTSYLLVPAAEDVQISHRPRLSSCRARAWLGKFVNEVFQNADIAHEQHFQLMQAPTGSLISGCDGAGRRLAALGKCKKPTPTCSTVKMVGYIEKAFVSFKVPQPKIDLALSKLVMNSLLLACIALLEHVANVKLYSDRNGYQVVLSADLVAVGMCNICGCMSGSFLVAAGFSRSALNQKARTQVSGLLSCFVSLGVIYAAAPLLSILPDSVLGVILFMAVIHLVDYSMVFRLARLGKPGLMDFSALAIAFSATCFLGVVQGMAAAVGFSLVVFVFNSSYPQIVELQRTRGTTYYAPHAAANSVGLKQSCLSVASPSKAKVRVLRFEAPLWFANASRFLDQMLKEARSASEGLILDMSMVPWIDFSAGIAIQKLMSRAEERNVTILFAHADKKVEDMIVAVAGTDKSFFFDSNYDAFAALKAMAKHSMSCARDNGVIGDPVVCLEVQESGSEESSPPTTRLSI